MLTLVNETESNCYEVKIEEMFFSLAFLVSTDSMFVDGICKKFSNSI